MPIVLLRLCPSGSYVASSPIWHCLCLLQVRLTELSVPDKVQSLIGAVCLRLIAPILCHASVLRFLVPTSVPASILPVAVRLQSPDRPVL